MPDLVLYMGNKNYSSWSLRPWLAMRHAGIPFTDVVIPLDQPETHAEILRRSPSGRVPALVHGDLTVWDSLAICEYVAEAFPDARLWPADARARAVARAVTCEMHSGFAALRAQLTMNLRGQYAVRPDADARADIARVVALWTDCRARFGGGGPLLFGAFSIADAFFAPVVSRFRTYGIPLDGVARDYADAVWALPAMQELLAAAKAERLEIPKYELRQ